MLPDRYCGDATAPNDVTDFVTVRHGETENNLIRIEVDGVPNWIAQGRGTNAGLNETGKQEARAAGNILRRLPVEQVVCSPQERALQTAFLANLGVALKVDSNLAERDFGPHEGKLGPLEMFEDNFDGCEHTEDFSRRVAKAMEHARCAGTVYFTHGGPIRVMARLLGVELREEHFRNGRVLHFQREGSHWKVETYESPVVMISGASGGIGLATVREFWRAGYSLSLGARNFTKLREVLGPENAKLHFALFDAEQPITMEEWVKTTVEKFGRIDVLVNNAGAGEHFSLMDDNDEGLSRLWTVNAVAPLRLIRLCMPHLEEGGRGRVINIGSMSGKRVKNEYVGYNMTKFALAGLHHTARYASWRKGVRLTLITPGFVNTKMSSYTDMVRAEEKTQPETVASAVRFATELPNNSEVGELPINCSYEERF